MFTVDFTHLAILFILLTIIYSLYLRHIHSRTITPLLGPPSKSFFFGCRHYINKAPDPGLIYEQWAAEYGSVYKVPDALGSSRIVITDPKALAHVYSRETVGYVHSTFSKLFLSNAVSANIGWVVLVVFYARWCATVARERNLMGSRRTP
jgi:hypothetical protein